MGGDDKLLLPVAGGIPLLADRIKAASATGQPVYVALPGREQAAARWACLDGFQAQGVAISNPDKGLSASLKGGLAALPGATQAALILPADMPDITTNDMRSVLQAFAPGKVARGCNASGKPGHPVLIPADWFDKLSDISGDVGARDLLRAATDQILVPLPASHAHCDLDTPEDWINWRAGIR
ncbi:MAG TPA: nucleotidyltransferase family protein [Aliiroseovarius sp.]|nr:nucleotidyltransferase family protein [Aliiroseovarius sp.]